MIPSIHKLTVYSTPEQWDRISKWSSPGAAAGGEDSPWLHMSLSAPNKYQEIMDMMQELKKRLEPEGIQVHIPFNEHKEWSCMKKRCPLQRKNRSAP